jgi:signal transduction histidine kinase/CheY-like chemotaxis protein
MPRILLSFLIIFLTQNIRAANLDSLYAIINSPHYTDSIKLESYESITKHLLKTDRDSCRKVCREGLEFSQKLNNQRFVWSFYNRIGITYYYESNFETAIEYWLQALEIAEESDDVFTISQSINNIAVIYDLTNNYKKAIEFYQKAINLKKKDKETKLISIAMAEINIAILYGKLGDFGEMERTLKLVLEKVPEINDPGEKHKIYTNIGSAYSYLGSNRDILDKKLIYEGLKYMFLAEAEIDETDYPMDKITILLNIGETYLQLDEPENGLKTIWRAKKIADEIGSLERQKMIYEVLKNHFYNVANYKLAYNYNDSAQRINDSINSQQTRLAITEMQTRYETEKKERQNLKLKQELLEQEIARQKQKRINVISVSLLLAFIIFGLVVSHFSYRLHNKNQELIKNKNELETLNHDLVISKEETEKALEFKSLFLANMSHEIRTPLNIIIGFNSILKRSIRDTKLQKYLESIETSSYNLLRFLNDILDMSKIEAGKIHLNPESINLKLLVTNIKELFMLKAAEKNLDIIVEFDKRLPDEILIDEIRLRQILVNLVGNAIKFTETGHVKIKVDAPTPGNYPSGFPAMTNLRIQIEDTGIGISETDIEKIFESFRQVNIKEQKQLGGTGLGLPISKRLTEMLQGELTVKSKKGQGSTFTIFIKNIPIGKTIHTTSQEKTNLSADLNYEFTGGVILVADDEDMNRSLIRVCFEDTKVEVLEASDGEETIKIARMKKPDIILMDAKMPVIDGIEATKIIKNDEELRDIKIIAFSASNIFDSLEKEEVQLFAGLLTKPINIEELFDKVKEVLPHKSKSGQTLPGHESNTMINGLSASFLKLSTQQKDKISEQFNHKWAETFRTNSMNKILIFTAELKQFAIENQLDELRVYTEKIEEAGSAFDIDTIKNLLKIFPIIIHPQYFEEKSNGTIL